MSLDQRVAGESYEQLRMSLKLFRQGMEILSAHIEGRLRAVGVVVTAGCNLACPYCPGERKTNETVSWENLKSVVDLLAQSRHPAPEITFHGGEPMLHFGLIRDVVAYAGNAAWAGSPPRFRISTNGTLLNDDAVRFFAKHAIETQLSFDGVQPAQEMRAPGTFSLLDKALCEIQRRHPEFFNRLLRINITLTSKNLPFLAESIAYFVDGNVKCIQVCPLITHDSGWTPDSTEELDHQLQKIREVCITRYEQSHEVPFMPFQPREPPDSTGDHSMCGVVRGDSVVVDHDGSVIGCIAFANFLRSGGSRLLRECLTPLQMGDIRCSDFGQRLATYRSLALNTPLLTDKKKKHTLQRKCCDCRFVSTCAVCPIAIGTIPGNEDPHLLPENLCAFEYSSATHREAFWGALEVEGRDRAPEEDGYYGGCQ